MGNCATVRLATLALVLSPIVAAEGATTLPKTASYTYFVGGKRVGKSTTRIVQAPDALRFESQLRVERGSSVVELTTETEADPDTYLIRRFSYRGTRGGKAAVSNITIEGDSAFGTFTVGPTTSTRGRRLLTTPIVVWEDWVMEIHILLALYQAPRGDRASTFGLVPGVLNSSNTVTFGYTGEVSVDGSDRSIVGRKLLVALMGGEPFESFIDPKRGIPVYIRFPGTKGEVFLDEFFGDNPTPAYQPKPAPPTSP